MERLPAFSEAELSAVISAIDTSNYWRDRSGQHLQELHTKTGERCLEASQEMLSRFEEILEEYKDSDIHPDEAKEIAELLAEYRKLGEGGFLDEQFALVENNIHRGTAKVRQSLLYELEKCRSAHVHFWSEFKELQHAPTPFAEQMQEEMKGVFETLAGFEPRHAELQENLRALYASLEAENNNGLMKVDFRPIAEVAASPDLVPFAHENPAELALLLKHLHHPTMREAIEAELGIDLKQISLKAQIHLMRYLSRQETEGFAALRQALEKYPELSNTILEAFVANAERDSFAKVLLSLPQHFSQDFIGRVLNKYLEVVNAGEDFTASAAELGNSSGLSVSPAQLQLRAANQFLHALTIRSRASGNPEQVITHLDSVKHELLALGVALRDQQRNGAISSLAEVRGLRLENAAVETLSTEVKDQLEALYRKNWESEPSYSAIHREKVLAAHRQAMESANSRVYMVKHGDEILAFLRVDELSDGTLHMGALNQRQEMDSSSIGVNLFRHVLTVEASDRPVLIELTAKKSNLISQYEGLGFVRLPELIENWEGTGVDLVQMIRPAPRPEQSAQ